ncbi:SDR family oxidoreductase [Rubrimonas cliftonensis]|uniref:NAD(P)-dependent dehydrogenase, short-chain alcohol dehydrogenase family n=1 Tax=Rubrimonas cliftonensis TaxID=89524 RepID=A0A1H3VHA7_9RHOB|nr:SDR family oxidoreductase [Rubrimonas cliftonensis]SDZ74120.1 NAD(P)-dependent dehydrogenase, short-chain alcohol dehydrogenase family [Rubrimonas cliftonensis]
MDGLTGAMAAGAALVTGSGKRLGREMALDLAAQRWSVAIHCKTSVAEAEATALEAEAAGAPRAAVVRADLLDGAAVDRLVADAAAALDAPLTLLVNSASIFEHDDIDSASRESWDRHIDSNLWAPFRLTQHFAEQAPAPGVDEDGLPYARACVVNLIDQRVWKLTPQFMTYTIAKAGLWTFTRTAAQALAPRIRVNAIGPGPTMQGVRQSAAHFAAQRAATPLERGAAPADIVAALRYILGARSFTGQMLAIDGGQHLGWRTPDVLGVE